MTAACMNCNQPLGEPHAPDCRRACPRIENDTVHLVDVPTKALPAWWEKAIK